MDGRAAAAASVDAGAVRAARQQLLLQAGAVVPPRSPAFRWPPHAALLAAQEHFVQDLGLAQPEGQTYARALAKALIGRLEEAVSEAEGRGEEAEVDGGLLEVYAELLSGASGSGSSLTTSVPPPQTRAYYFPRSLLPSQSQGGDASDGAADAPALMRHWACVRLLEDGTTIAQGTTGLRTWEASLRLGAHLLARPPRAGARILELGAGAGFLGLLAAQLCPAQLVLTDLEGPVLARLRSSVALNAASARADVRPLDWCAPDEALLRAARADVVLAADVVFDPSLVAPLAHTLRRALELGAQDAHALVALTLRNAETFARFEAALAAEKLCVQPRRLEQPRLPAGAPQLGLFPSAHEPGRDGELRLLEVRLMRLREAQSIT